MSTFTSPKCFFINRQHPTSSTYCFWVCLLAWWLLFICAVIGIKSVPRPGLSVSTLPQPTSNPTDGPFSFLGELLNDNPAPFTSPECEPPALGSHGLENVDMPMDVPLQSSLHVPVKVNAWITAMPSTGGREGGTHSYGSRGLQNPSNVSLMSSPHTPATGNIRMATSMRGPKPAVPSPNVPYQLASGND